MARSNTQPMLLTLKTAEHTVGIPATAEHYLKRAAQEWSYILKNRDRWRRSSELVREQHRRCRETLEELGVSENDQRLLGESDFIEVSIPWTGEEESGWAARIFPWEFLLSSVTNRGNSHLVVVRHLARPSTSARGPRPKALSSIGAGQVAMILSDPDPVGDFYDFSAEAEIPTLKLSDDKSEKSIPLRNLNLEQLAVALKERNAAVWHFMGVDNLQGRELMEQSGYRSEQIEELVPAIEGLVLADSRQRPRGATALQLGQKLGRLRPQLAIFNVYRSAARTAALMVAYGAGAAVGFQDTVKDQVAEKFIRSLYDGLKHSQGIHQAFATALRFVRETCHSLSGTGMVLWSDQPLFEGGEGTRRRKKVKSEAVEGSQATVKALMQRRSQPLDRTQYPSLRPCLQFDIHPRDRINYSLLHNRRPPLERLRIVKGVPEIIGPLRVRVALDVAASRSEWVRTLELYDDVTDLAEEILLPLTAFGMAMLEDTRTSLTVTVVADQEVLYENTFGVTLAPAHEWEDSDKDRCWLPSFVLPEDPAVRAVVSDAGKYLRGLREDYFAGFDGYQSVNPRKKNYEVVDDQAQSLWHTLREDRRLQYINPPAGTHSGRQRLRIPASIIRQGRGTCIDLALLYASCLEQIEIYPVIFLLQGHAFAGYWRTEGAHQQFIKVAVSGQNSTARSDDNGVKTTSWTVAGRAGHREVSRLVQLGHLVPLETTGLTFGYGFHEAIEEGVRNLRNRDEFHSIIDISLAREANVTPLPTLGESS